MGEVKGLDFHHVLIYPTKPMEKWIKDTNSELSGRHELKLYVAVTRANISTGIIVPKFFDVDNSMIQYWPNEII